MLGCECDEVNESFMCEIAIFLRDDYSYAYVIGECRSMKRKTRMLPCEDDAGMCETPYDIPHKNEERCRSLVESSANSIYLVDRSCRYLFMNRKCLSRLHIKEDEYQGRSYSDFHSPEETQQFAMKVNHVFETGASIQYEYNDNSGKYFLKTLSPVKDSETGVVTAVTVVSIDITELKRAEKEREQLIKELEAKNDEMERFVYTISHDLRAPLMTIQGFVEMLRKDMIQDKNNTANIRMYLEYIEGGVSKMERLLSETLELSRIGRVTNPLEDVSFGDIVGEALEMTMEQIKSSGIEISLAEEFPVVHVDRMRVMEVLVNLIENSINYMGEQRDPRIEIGYRIEKGETVFFVRDNGIGIDPSQHEKVFELFYQVETNNRGTGAGLAIVKRIIEMHKGRIWIESERGKGCTVCFTLPVVN